MFSTKGNFPESFLLFLRDKLKKIELKTVGCKSQAKAETFF